MAYALSPDQVRCLRLRAQRLGPRSTGSASRVADIVRDVGGIQAQEAPAAALSVRVRGAGLTAADVERALVDERSIVRTWAQRGTLHLLHAEDICWLLPLLGPVFNKPSQRRLELGLDEDTGARGVRAIRDLLASQGPQTRAELAEQLSVQGIPTAGQAIAHLVHWAALEGVICLGPNRGSKPTYVLLDDWIDRGRPMAREAALAELAYRYLAAYGPARLDDLVVWSGLPVRDARVGWERVSDQLLEVEIDGRAAWILKARAGWLDEPPASPPVVRLLPRFDTYLLGYRSRDLAVPPEHAKYIHPGGGLVHRTILANGRAVGTWQIVRKRESLEVVVEPFDALAADLLPGVEAEVEDVGHFFGLPSRMRIMAPS